MQSESQAKPNSPTSEEKHSLSASTSDPPAANPSPSFPDSLSLMSAASLLSPLSLSLPPASLTQGLSSRSRDTRDARSHDRPIVAASEWEKAEGESSACRLIASIRSRRSVRTNPILSLRPVYASRPSLVSPAKEGVRGRGQRIQVSKVSGVFACIHAHPLLSHPAFTEDRQSCSARGARGRQQDTGSLKNSVHTSTADEDVIDDDDDEQKQSAYLASISRSVTLDSQFSSLPFPSFPSLSLSLALTCLPPPAPLSSLSRESSRLSCQRTPTTCTQTQEQTFTHTQSTWQSDADAHSLSPSRARDASRGDVSRLSWSPALDPWCSCHSVRRLPPQQRLTDSHQIASLPLSLSFSLSLSFQSV